MIKKILSKIDLFLRSLLFSVLMVVITFFYSFFCVAVYPFAPFHCRYRIIVFWCRAILGLLETICRIHYRLEGSEHVTKDGACIVLSKHQSAWETFFLPTLFSPSAIIIKRELLWVPFFGWGLATINPIAINRNKGANAVEQIIRKGKTCLEQGRWVLIFPEGTRSLPGKPGKYRAGGTRLAAATGRPIIPVAHNAGLYWRKRGFIKKPGTIRVIVGPVIGPNGRSPEALLEEVKSWIEAAQLEIEHPLARE